MPTLQQTIQEIIHEVPSGDIFDSHFVIRQLIRRNYDAYLAFVCRFDPTTVTGARADGLLAQEITPLVDQGVVDRLPEFESWSETVSGNPNKCACWRKK